MKMNKLILVPINFATASEFIKNNHRHHLPPVGWKYGIGASDGEKLIGVITVGRPVARKLDNGMTLEVTRCCTDGSKNACSFLYSAAWRAAKALGYKRLITYILKEESGTSLVASGWKELYHTPGASWSVPTRPREDKHPLGQKTLWEVAA